MKISKEFWIDRDTLDVINNDSYENIVIGIKSTSRLHKITITYEIDREITIKESKFEKILEKLHISNNDLAERAIGRSLRYELFGGGENE